MRSTYRVFAYIIAAEVVLQAAMMAFAVAGLFTWIDKDGGMLDKAVLESEPDFTGAVGFMIHGMNGMMLIPLLALIFLIISFFAKIPQGVRWAVIVLVCTFVQIALGTLSRLLAPIGALHGAVALVLFGVAVMAAMRAQKPAAVEEPVPAAMA